MFACICIWWLFVYNSVQKLVRRHLCGCLYLHLHSWCWAWNQGEDSAYEILILFYSVSMCLFGDPFMGFVSMSAYLET